MTTNETNIVAAVIISFTTILFVLGISYLSYLEKELRKLRNKINELSIGKL